MYQFKESTYHWKQSKSL